jgi:hypothetical protein
MTTISNPNTILSTTDPKELQSIYRELILRKIFTFPGITMTSTSLLTLNSRLNGLSVSKEIQLLDQLNQASNIILDNPSDAINQIIALLQEEVQQYSSSSEIFNSPW